MAQQTSNIVPAAYCGEAKEIVANIRDGVAVSVFGVSAGERMHIASSLSGFFVYVVPDFLSARAAASELSQLCGGAVAHLPSRADVLTYTAAKSVSGAAARAAALADILFGRARGVVVTPDTLLQLMPTREQYVDNTVTVSTGMSVRRDALVNALTAGGYLRADMVESVGQYSVRGDLVDVFPAGASEAVRIEFWGDTVESIKQFDSDTQRSEKTLDTVGVFPIAEVFVSDADAPRIAKRLRADMPKKLAPDNAERLNRIVTDLETKLADGGRDGSAEFLLPYAEHGYLTDLLPKNAVIVYDETKQLFDNLSASVKEHRNRYAQLLESGEVCISSVKQMTDFETLKIMLAPFFQLSFARITSSNLFFSPQKLYNFTTSPVPRYNGNFAELAADTELWLKRGYRIIVCAKDAETAAAAAKSLTDFGVWAEVREDALGLFVGSDSARLVVLPRLLDKGFTYHDAKIVVVGSFDLYPQKASAVSRTNSRAVFSQPVSGDYVVHSIHGIGRCVGPKRMTTSMGTKDYIEIEYRDGDKLYVPIDQMDLLSKFGGTAPRLSKMGGAEFLKVKQKVKAGIKDMAFDLVKLYSARNRTDGHKYNIDAAFLQEFIDRFPYQSTPDQVQAFDEIRGDLACGKIMDRLLVGDVGYGKTEVALRAAFAVVAEGKQTAILAPTTILSEQHFVTCKARFEPYGIRVGVINRFCSSAEQTAVLKRLAAGELDVICGTHRLLSADVAFSDLGLLVLDEEQRFGVSDKEKLKTFKTNVNVLSMTATPIPRTLHMSMSGIRDISTLANPPSDRLPVQTFVTEYTESLVRDAVEREIGRGGQVFVIYNRVETIERFASGLKNLIPGARIIVGHGQMNETRLENNIKLFYDGEADVLVSTTIVENGIDLPNANTLIVVDADCFGLSQLYQLRGRVGRSNRLAYAYLTFHAGKTLTDVAHKRLATLMEFTEFGSGFRIAMRDLEIRGAGNVLGREQHGHMEKVGYDLYCKMLAEAVAEVRSGEGGSERAETPVELECAVYIDIDAYIPAGYIEDDEGRMRLYGRIAGLRSMADRDRLLQELKDIYGTVPKPLSNLVNIGLYKGLGVRLNCQEIRMSKAQASLTLRTLEGWVVDMAAKNPLDCVLKMAVKPTITFGLTSKYTVYEAVFAFLIEAVRVKSLGKV